MSAMLREMLALRSYELASPEYLWLGWVLAAAALALPLRLLLSARWSLAPAPRWEGKRGLAPGRAPWSLGRALALLPWLLALAGLTLLWVALLRPQKVTTSSQQSVQALDIMLSLDVSGSMRADDVKPTRVDGAKRALTAFVDALPGDRVGLVVFAGRAFVQCPLSLDHEVVKHFIREVEIGNTVRLDGTSVGDGLLAAVERLLKEPGRNSVIVLATDGRSNTGVDPRQAAQVAAAAGIKVYTIGIGQRGGYVVTGRDFFGRPVQQRMEEPDEGLLQAIASQTGGMYFRATDERGLSAVYERIAGMERREVKVRKRRDAEEHFYPYLSCGAALLALAALLGLRFRLVM